MPTTAQDLLTIDTALARTQAGGETARWGEKGAYALFVRDVAADPSDEAMVRSIQEIAALLGKHTAAECVEGEAAMRCLREIGVDYVQGYGIERPILIEALARG